MKRIVTIQDLSCVGKCALSVALPVICAMGVETAVLPTAVLSTHTAFPDAFVHDLTGDFAPISAHWKQQDIGFDAIYTGYLASMDQVRLVETFIDDYKTAENLVVVDPVMADHGKLYKGFDADFVRAMASLCARADIIMPNMTEAAMLLGEACNEANCDADYREHLLRRLSGLGPRYVMLTGVRFENDNVGVAVYDQKTDSIFTHCRVRIPANF